MGSYNQYKARGCSYAECKSQHMLHTLALWGLVTIYGDGGGGGGLQNGRVGASTVLPLQKRGGVEKSFSRAEREGGGAQKVLR